MYATASEAMQGLRHARTGEVLPSKTIARNTKLLYLDEDLVGLRFHDTIIARYEREGVRIDTRDRVHPQGWFTVTTWNRIDQFTPARTFTREGLRHILIDPMAGGIPYQGKSLLYAHGAFVSPDGSCEIDDMTREQSNAIIHIKRNMGDQLKRWCAKVVEHWRTWEQPKRCCERAQTSPDQDVRLHYFGHFNAREPVVPPDLEMLAQGPRGRMLEPDQLAAEVARLLTDDLKKDFLPLAIAQIAPDFPYPQTTPRRR